VTLAPAVGEVDSAKIGEKRAGYGRRFIRGSCATHPDDFTKLFWERITGWLKDGVIRPSKFRVIDGLDADEINAALDEYRDMGGMKVQVHPNI
jgi:NADPH2:quinone reductase